MARPAPRSLLTPNSVGPPSSPRDAAEPHPDADPQSGPRPAVGYVCLPGDEDQINGLHHCLDVQARHAGLDLVEVFVDRLAPDEEIARPGLALAVAEIARHLDAVLLVPDLSHLPTSREGWAAWEEWFTSVVTEVHSLSTAAIPTQNARSRLVTAVRRSGDEARLVEVGDGRLTARGQFEVTVRPDDDAASVIAVLRQLPPEARFVESWGDVDTTLIFVLAPRPELPAGWDGFDQARSPGR
ncbi:hypothetical protein [Pseudofrankia sp. DC12]|uniref:hypothetical protein n=1 Tax=Pseudofrankia sp. DC12 TaxID=683315 RepID=UPI0005F7B4E9|nr:hypothetical protein [Pseudofrankia sp. DC12]